MKDKKTLSGRLGILAAMVTLVFAAYAGFEFFHAAKGAIANVEQMQEQSKHFQQIGLPQGTVAMWWGSINTIPEDWELCDGEPSTKNPKFPGRKPNLVDKFPKGASKDDKVANELDSGGSHFFTLQLDNIPAHTHSYVDGWFSEKIDSHAPAIGRQEAPDGWGSAGGIDMDNRIWTRPMETGYTPAEGSNVKKIDNRPRFQELFFIIKVK